MKKLLSLLIALAVAIPAFARPALRLHNMTAGSPASLTPQAVAPDVPARVLRQLHERITARRSGVHATAVADEVSGRSFVIPVAGSAPGGGGTLFFRSDVTLVNYASAAQKVLVGFWAAGSTNNLNPANFKQITLNSNQFVTTTDFVASVMGTSGIGSLVFIPFNGTDFDPNGAIDGTSRIYTKQPGSNGTVSQPFDGVNSDTLSNQFVDEGVALGLRQDNDFRTNYGIVNVDDKTRNYKITFVGANSTTNVTRTIPAFGLLFEAAPAGNFGALQVLIQCTDAGSDFVTWIGFASSTDNITGDGWVSIASADLSPDELDFIGY